MMLLITSRMDSKPKINSPHLPVFLCNHQLETGIGRFASNIEIADAWTRLQNGNFVKHEYFETRLKGIFKTNYTTTHYATNDSGRKLAPEEFVTKPEMNWRP